MHPPDNYPWFEFSLTQLLGRRDQRDDRKNDPEHFQLEVNFDQNQQTGATVRY